MSSVSYQHDTYFNSIRRDKNINFQFRKQIIVCSESDTFDFCLSMTQKIIPELNKAHISDVNVTDASQSNYYMY